VSGVVEMAQEAMNAAADVMTELTSFTKFQKRIDELIRDLKESPADHRQVGMDQPARVSFGGGDGSWGSADTLGTAHAKVIGELENLSKLLLLEWWGSPPLARTSSGRTSRSSGLRWTWPHRATT
jgi:hypothetical protein